MELTLPNDLSLSREPIPHFYTNDELALLHGLENGQVETLSHDQVMENLRKKLGLDEK